MIWCNVISGKGGKGKKGKAKRQKKNPNLAYVGPLPVTSRGRLEAKIFNEYVSIKYIKLYTFKKTGVYFKFLSNFDNS